MDAAEVVDPEAGRAYFRSWRYRLRLEVVCADKISADLGDWARGYALDQQLSGEKARSSLGWEPTHLDPESEIASMT
jgi:hypothetical protein